MLSRIHTLWLFVGTIVWVCLIGGCTEKFDLSSITSGASPFTGDTTYVEIFPPWGGFNQPRALVVGKDELFYVADYGNNRVLMLNVAGHVLASRSFEHPIALGQDSKLDLLVAGEMRGLGGDTIGAIFRLHIVYDKQRNFYGHEKFGIAPVETVWSERSWPRRRLLGIAVFPDNQYLLARSGKDTSDNSSPIDPDTRILLFNKDDRLITPLGDLVTRTPPGTDIRDINQVTSIASLPGRKDFIVTQSSKGGIAYGCIWMNYLSTADFEGWLPKFDPSKPQDRNVDFIRPRRFSRAEAVAFDKKKGDIFIVDSQLDSVMKFDSRGRYRKESFGDYLARTNDFPDGFNRPSGVAFHEKTLYVVDTGHNVIRLFRLSLDLQ